jgi:magnesium-transporting ATPase (P-type)
MENKCPLTECLSSGSSPVLVSGTTVTQGDACFVSLVIGEDTCQNQQMLASEQLIEKENPPLIDKIEGVTETMRSASIFAALFTLFLMIMRIIFEMT